jgi:hypothetical protein
MTLQQAAFLAQCLRRWDPCNRVSVEQNRRGFYVYVYRKIDGGRGYKSAYITSYKNAVNF